MDKKYLDSNLGVIEINGEKAGIAEIELLGDNTEVYYLEGENGKKITLKFFPPKHTKGAGI